MKSIEQKAKAYDLALERAKRLYEQGTITESLSYVFPQLKKLGDGEVRKEIMQLIQGMHDADPRKERWLAWLEKQGEQKPAWSEEDEKMVNNILTPLAGRFPWNIYQPMYDWLKSLKSRVQPKQEWSEEDALRLEEVICMIEANGRWVRSDDAVKSVLDWLKSLQQRIGE